MIIKKAHTTISSSNVKHNALDVDDPEILSLFKKTAADLKAIAPRAKDFLYFTCIMMHAAEASAINDDGTIKKNADGSDAKVWWDKNGESWIWRSTNPNIKPYKNANSDIFPEEELKLAYKKWVGKPLCVDHESSKADKVRGLIVDTVYDDKYKRIIALCALDKVNWPDLARNVETGVNADVSMGTAVSKAICTENGCHRVARTEADFCEHMVRKNGYGEINVGLSPIELSIVVTGADQKAKIRRVIAAADSLNKYIESRESMDAIEAPSLIKAIAEIKKELNLARDNMSLDHDNSPYGQPGRGSVELAPDAELPTTETSPQGFTARFASDIEKVLMQLQEKVNHLDIFINKMASDKESINLNSEDINMGTKKQAYHLGGGGVNDPASLPYPKEDYQTIRDNDDKQMTGASPFPEVGSVDGTYPGLNGNELALKQQLKRAKDEQDARRLRRAAALEKAKSKIESGKLAYHLGGGDVNDPAKLPYPKENYENTRDKEDKQMTGKKPFPEVGDVTGLYGEDLKEKQRIQRAKLEAKFVKASKSDGSEDLNNSRWDVFAKTDNGSRLILTATVKDLAGDSSKVNALYPAIATNEYGKTIMRTIRAEGLEMANQIFKGAQEMPAPTAPVAPVDPAAPAAPAAPTPVPETGMPMDLPQPEEENEYGGEEGSPVDHINTITNDLENDIAELQKAVESLEEESDEIEAAEEEVGMQAPAVATASATLPQMRKGLNVALRQGCLKAIAELKDSKDELSLVKDLYAKNVVAGATRSLTETLVADAMADAHSNIVSANVCKQAIASYRRGTKALLKNAQASMEPDMTPPSKLPTMPDWQNAKLPTQMPSPQRMPVDPVQSAKPMSADDLDLSFGDDASGCGPKPSKSEDESWTDYNNRLLVWRDCQQGSGSTSFHTNKPKYDSLSTRMKADDETIVLPEDEMKVKNPGVEFGLEELIRNIPVPEKFEPRKPQDSSKADFSDADDETIVLPEDEMKVKNPGVEFGLEELIRNIPEQEEFKPSKPQDSSKADFSSACDNNAALGDEVASQIKGDIMEALKSASRAERDAARMKLAQKALQFSEMLNKAHPAGGKAVDKGELSVVETGTEQHNKIMDVAVAPPKVRKTAEQINMLVVAGDIDPTKDFPGLIAQGLDESAVAYWKKFYGQAENGAEFASELVKEHQKKKAETEMASYRVKLARAYELSHDMASRGIISNSRESINNSVDDLMKSSDEHFTQFKSMVEKYNLRKEASYMPQVGVQDTVLGAPSVTLPRSVESTDLVSEFAKAFGNRKY